MRCHSGAARRAEPGTQEHGPRRDRHRPRCPRSDAGVRGFRVRGRSPAPRN